MKKLNPYTKRNRDFMRRNARYNRDIRREDYAKAHPVKYFGGCLLVIIICIIIVSLI